METKNDTNNKASFLKKGLLLTAVSLLLITTAGFSQVKYTQPKTKVVTGVFAGSMISANGYGGMHVPMLFYKKDRRSYFIGPVIQNRKLNVSGVQFNFDYTLAGEDAPGNETYNPNLEFFCFFTAAYHNKALLGRRALWEEERANNEYVGNVCRLNFRSAEVYGGVGLKIKLFNYIKWTNCIGLGGYTSFDFPGHLYYNASNIGLILKTGISIDLTN